MSKAAKDKEEKNTYVIVTNIAPTTERLLANESALTEIRLLGFGITLEDVQNLSYALTENKVLQHLSLDHLSMGDDAAEQLSQGICYNSSLLTLSMRWNKLGDKGGHAIANSLHYNQTLKELVLSFNELGDKSAKSFALAMKRNNSLETLDLKWNKIGDQCGDLLLDSMADNRTLVNLYLGGNGSALRNVGRARATRNQSTAKRFLSTIGIGGNTSSQKSTQTITLDQLRKDTAAKSASEIALHQARMAQEHAPPVQQLPTEIQVGDWVQVKGQGGQLRKGKVAYVGETQFADGLWCGVVFDSPQGKNDGSVSGVRYFTCPPNHGSFLRPEKLVILQDERDNEDLDDMISGMNDMMSNDVGGPSTSSYRGPAGGAGDDDAINDLDDMLSNMDGRGGGGASSSSGAPAGGGLFDDDDPFMM